jgi:hypothetical protein
MAPVAKYLARRETAPHSRQSRIGLPNAGWASIQASSRGQPRLAAQAATRMKGAVGMTGKKAPIRPSSRETMARLRQRRIFNGRTEWDGATAGCPAGYVLWSAGKQGKFPLQVLFAAAASLSQVSTTVSGFNDMLCMPCRISHTARSM